MGNSTVQVTLAGADKLIRLDLDLSYPYYITEQAIVQAIAGDIMFEARRRSHDGVEPEITEVTKCVLDKYDEHIALGVKYRISEV